MEKVLETVLKSTPPAETVEGGIDQESRSLQSPTQVWLRRVAFLIAAASPALGCSGSGSGDVCAAYAAKTITCEYYAGYSQEYVEQYCNSYLEYAANQYGAMCHAAFEDYYACVSHLSCAQIDSGSDVCVDEEERIAQRCD